VDPLFNFDDIFMDTKKSIKIKDDLFINIQLI